MAEVDAEAPGRSVTGEAAAEVDVAVVSRGVVIGVATVDVSALDGVAVPVCKPPRKLPVATETPTSNRRRSIVPRPEASNRSGAGFCLMAWSRMA